MWALGKPVYLFVMVSISDNPTVKYWQSFEEKVCAKDDIPKKKHNWRYMFYVISNYRRKFIHEISQKYINHVQTKIKDLLSVIITLGTNVNGEETVFNMELLSMTLRKDQMFLSIHMEGVCWVPLINVSLRLYLDRTQRCFILYPTNINISSLFTSWY